VKLGLALSGGSLRGAAHIGVLEVLLENGIEPDMVAGTSAGSVVGSLFAHGLHPKTIHKIATSIRGKQLIDWTTNFWGAFSLVFRLPLYFFGLTHDFSKWFPEGFIRGQKFEQYLSELFNLPATRKQLPLFITAVDLHTAESLIFTNHMQPRYQVPGCVYIPFENDLVAAVRASCSMPGLFTPRQFGQRTLIDGAIRLNIPAELLFQAGCDKVIAIDLLRSEMSKQSLSTFYDVMMRSWDIMTHEITALQLYDEKIFAIQPIIQDVGWTSFDKIEYCIEQGRQAALAALPELKKYIL